MTQEAQTINLKIMSYNIHHGAGMDTILDLSRIAKIINENAPDLCALQEVDNFCLRSDSINQTQYLAQNTSMTGTFGEFMPYQGGAYGMATLSNKTLLTTKVVSLPDGIHEPRTSIVHEVQLSQKHSVLFANVHFDWVAGAAGDFIRLKQAKALVAYLNTFDAAAIITGDFNCEPTAETMKYFAAQGFVFVDKGDDNLSYQGETKSEIDHLIYRNGTDLNFKTKGVRLIYEPVTSDHRPLLVALSVVLN